MSIHSDNESVAGGALDELNIKYTHLLNNLHMTKLDNQDNATKYLNAVAELEQKNEELNTVNYGLKQKLEDGIFELIEMNCELADEIEHREKAELELSALNVSLEDEVEERTRELIKARDDANAANIAKSQFLANMSHELRTPMHWILNYSSFAIKKLTKHGDGMDKELHHFVSEIKEGGTRLLKLLNNILDLSKMDAGKTVFDIAPNDIVQTINNSIVKFRNCADEKNITIGFSSSGEAIERNFDQEYIMQVMTNLLSNAIKFSPENQAIEVVVECSDVTTLVSVADRGPGVPQDETEMIFDKFVQSSKTCSGAGGTGLGLAICKDIISSHNGRIWCSDNPNGNGSVFSFTLPV